MAWKLSGRIDLYYFFGYWQVWLDMVRFYSLLEEGLTKMGELKIVKPDPQLADLLDMAHKALDKLKQSN